MNQKIQLYIENVQVDVFQDGSINIVSSIKDFRSPDKLFTDFSRNFTLPATARNNKVFKHYYNYDILDGGFDASYFQSFIPKEKSSNNINSKKKIRPRGMGSKSNYSEMTTEELIEEYKKLKGIQ